MIKLLNRWGVTIIVLCIITTLIYCVPEELQRTLNTSGNVDEGEAITSCESCHSDKCSGTYVDIIDTLTPGQLQTLRDLGYVN